MFQIMRVKKLKSSGNLKASLEHMYRERATFNADPDKRHKNIDAGDVELALKKFDSIKVDRQQKNSVQAIEYLVTASVFAGCIELFD